MKKLHSLLFFLLFFSCQQQKAPVEVIETTDLINELLSQRVSQYIDVDEPIVIRFKDDVGDVGSNVTGIKVFDNNQGRKIEGEFSWEDSRTIVFRPNEALSYAGSYQLELNLDELNPNWSYSKNMIIGFETRALAMQLYRPQIKMVYDNDFVKARLQGEIATNQYVRPESIKKLLSINGIDFKEEQLTWTHSDNNKLHQFTIGGIEQKTKNQTISLSLNGGLLIPGFSDAKEVVLSGQEEFNVVAVLLANQESQNIEVTFSQPLKEDQDLRGLIKVNGKTAKVKTNISGNILSIYPERQNKEKLKISIAQQIQSYSRENLSDNFIKTVIIEPLKPQLRLADDGVIVPGQTSFSFPFEAMNLDSVDIEIFKIYSDNALQFLQDNQLSGSYRLDEVGTIEHKEKLSLSSSKEDLNQWQSIALDLSDYIGKDPSAIYQVRIGFRPSYIKYECENAVKDYKPRKSIMDYNYYYNGNYNDPCSAAYYYSGHFVSRNVLISNLGAVVKKSEGNTYNFAISNLSDGLPVTSAAIKLYSYQNQELGETSSNNKGMASVQVGEKVAFATVTSGDNILYLSLQDQSAKSVTDFNTGGSKLKDGIAAYLYSDRGVYRPGDTVYMHAMMSTGIIDLPQNHPVSLTVKDGQGVEKYKYTTATHLDGVYRFDIPTHHTDRTGRWSAIFEVGAVTFTKSIRVETIKPNRLRMELEKDDLIDYTNAESRKIKIKSTWLHGAPASSLLSKVEAKWASYYPDFKEYKEYEFADPARQLKTNNVVLYNTSLDAEGQGEFELKLDKKADYPAMIQANLTSRVFEKGGDFSEHYGQLKVSPYDAYVGVKLPKDRWGGSSVKIGDKANFSSVVVDMEGRPKRQRKLSVGVYDINWQWWYYRGQRYQIYELNSDLHTKAIIKKEVTTNANGLANISFDTDRLEYGRKLIRICDTESGHCTGSFFYASGWRSSISSEERNSLSKLQFTTGQPKYESGEEVVLKIPSQKGSKILVSIESNNKIIFEDWLEGKDEMTEYRFQATPNMAPNLYAYVSLIQPYREVNNDLPIRMYGVLPIMIKDPLSELHPEIKIAEELKPKENFEIEISEEGGRPMVYTVAIVDEGLLDLTNFKTPHPHGHFYAKRSSGLKMWDMYDDVLYGLNGRPDQIISVGGDGEGEDGKGQKKAIRFKPVVFSAGPFALDANEKKKHSFKMPNYLGSVKAMIVAKKKEAYGRTSKAVPVKTPLMILPTVPRTIAIGDRVTIPVSIFASKKNLGNINVTLKTSDNLQPIKSTQSIVMKEQGEEVINFEVLASEFVGVANILIEASSGAYKSSQEVAVDIQNPNPVITKSQEFTIEKGATWSGDFDAFGVSGSNQGLVELSFLPSLKLAGRLNYLVDYPYGCLEQTTSKGFAQLYLSDLTDYVSAPEIDRNVNAAIKRVLRMQQSSGGFSYWPGGRYSIHEWANSYVGHFLIEARKKGYYIPNSVLNDWSAYQEKLAKKYNLTNTDKPYLKKQKMLNQAYRLYVLALNGQPDLSSMNLLRAQEGRPNTSSFLLAAAYALSNKKSLALELIEGTSSSVDEYRDLGNTFGSEVRDLSLIAQSLSLLDRKSAAASVVKKIIDGLNSSRWYSTQSVSFGLLTVAQLSPDLTTANLAADVSVGGSMNETVQSKKPISSLAFYPEKMSNNKVTIENNSNQLIFGSIQMTGQQSLQDVLIQEASNNHIALDVVYQDLNGSNIDVSELKQGQDFKAVVTISNLNTRGSRLDELALTQVFPSGWEIRSGRLNQVNVSSNNAYDYRDVRDDRVHTFFDLRNKKTFQVLLNATYIGDYFLSGTTVEAMYDKSVNARTKGQMVRVSK